MLSFASNLSPNSNAFVLFVTENCEYKDREVLDNEEYGQYFTKKRGSLAGKINIIEENYKIVSNYRKKSRDRIVENYTWEKIVNQYRILINNI